MKDRRCVEDLTIEELEQILLVKKREARMARVRRLTSTGRMVEGAAALAREQEISPDEVVAPKPATPVHSREADAFHSLDVDATPTEAVEEEKQRAVARRQRWSQLRDRLLLVVEVGAVVGLVAVIVSFFSELHTLNQEVAAAREQPTPTATPLINVSVLPGGHSPPAVPGEVPEHLREWVEPAPAVVIATPGPQAPTRLVIPAIGVDVPVVEGDGWEQLKKGAGHHASTANPGERGNCFISGHNDIFGEIFRDLEKLELEDEIIVYAGAQPFHYRVKAKRIVEPDDVSVMYPTSTPVLTLMTCYPYLVDTHRLAVIAELVE
ncbi:MAG: class D sortase [Chloroflexota bacterium]|nr:class D sortase [Chloroflexota bacterium]